MKDFFQLRESLRHKQLTEGLTSTNHKEHIKTIDNHINQHSDKDGLHSDHDQETLGKVHHAHNQLARMHDAYATVHRMNGNHSAADAHEDAANMHHNAAGSSVKNPRWANGKVVHRDNRETHEEYGHYAHSANNETEHVMKHHPVIGRDK